MEWEGRTYGEREERGREREREGRRKRDGRREGEGNVSSTTMKSWISCVQTKKILMQSCLRILTAAVEC